MTRKTLLTLGLLAAFMLSACIPNTSAPAPTPDSGGEPAAAPVQDDPAPVQEEAPTDAPAPTDVPTEAAEPEPAAEEPVAVATSRGPQLVATDPSTVNLASGEPQLIEFFAFW